ncbi:hypothetical protein [Acetobacterium wieringae]|uniref:hypothetical protein n=1 Tax=Acetobacterium wieringae TaxID=52694 RepID=UPI002033423E|nr:hypothetical protein [Acetobacterium wieringae]URN83921.1 hypothetical protein CHL1_003082 [Acetobacterium wieringae]
MFGILGFHQWLFIKIIFAIIFNIEYLKIYVELLPVFATLGLGLLAFYQNKQFGKVNERLLLIEEMKFKPVIEFRNPTVELYHQSDVIRAMQKSDLYSKIEDVLPAGEEIRNYFRLDFELKNSTENIAKGFKLSKVKINTNKCAVKTYYSPETREIDILSKTEIMWSVFFNIFPKEDVHIFLYFEYHDLFDRLEINEYQVAYLIKNATVQAIKSI